jgi:hypothetical protein
MLAWAKDRLAGEARQGLLPHAARAKLRVVRGAAAVLLLCAVPATAAAQTAVRVELIDTAVLAARRIAESSGVAPSTRVRGILWTHNDSGDEPRLYATDSAGGDLGSVRVSGAKNVDWEDLASGPCVGTGASCLFVADIGDNARRRRTVVIYEIAEPAPPRAQSDTAREAQLLSATVLRYPDRPHDAEAIVVAPSGTMMIITKELAGRARVYRLPARSASPRPGQVSTLQFMGLLDLAPSLPRMRLVTGAAVSPDGKTLVVRTYSSLHFYRLHGDSLPTALTPPDGLPIPVVEPQGEGVAFAGPDRLVLTSEQGSASHSLMSRLRVLGLPHASP